MARLPPPDPWKIMAETILSRIDVEQVARDVPEFDASEFRARYAAELRARYSKKTTGPCRPPAIDLFSPSPRPTLTEKQEGVLEIIEEEGGETDYATIYERGVKRGFLPKDANNPYGTVHSHLVALEDKGLVRREGKKGNKKVRATRSWRGSPVGPGSPYWLLHHRQDLGGDR